MTAPQAPSLAASPPPIPEEIYRLGAICVEFADLLERELVEYRETCTPYIDRFARDWHVRHAKTRLPIDHEDFPAELLEAAQKVICQRAQLNAALDSLWEAIKSFDGAPAYAPRGCDSWTGEREAWNIVRSHAFQGRLIWRSSDVLGIAA